MLGPFRGNDPKPIYLPIAALVVTPFLVTQQLLLSGHVCGVRKDSGASGYMYVWDLVPLHIYLKMVVVEENGLGYHKRREGRNSIDNDEH